jgi:hypothetical protein
MLTTLLDCAATLSASAAAALGKTWLSASRPNGDYRIMTRNCRTVVLTACAAVLIAVSVAHAQSPTTLEQAELSGLSPEMRAQVQARAVGGNSVTEVLQVMLLNNIKIEHPASQIVAMDWGKGVAVVQLTSGGMQAAQFDPTTLQIKG